ncbi:riboflavin synthase domain-like protein [Mycena floridula]|nr:riboflavin synthase domain-like protein [Mycena floridula]
MAPLILYATETGTAQDVADQIARRCRRISMRCRIENMESYSLPSLISEIMVIFVVSTTGSGSEPRSMTPLWKTLLRSDLPADLFDELQFCVFGLGDSSYEKFCWPAKLLSRRLVALGAEEICHRGEGDEQDQLGIDGALQVWWETLQKSLLQLFPLPAGTTIPSSQAAPSPRTKLIEASALPSSSTLAAEHSVATVSCNRRITADDWYQDVRHFEFEFEYEIHYSPGDVAVIHPVANSDEVQAFLDSSNWADLADVPFNVTRAELDQSFPVSIPQIITLRDIFTRHLDFNATPRRSFFEFLRYFTADELEAERLDEFLSPQGADELYDYCFKVKRTIREVLSEFRQVKIPLDYIFDVFPALREREFSIASSNAVFPKAIHLCVAIVKYKTKLKLPRRGVCTSYLSGLRAGDKLPIRIKKGLIKLPKDPQTPIICVGPGTGIAPMRAVIQHRVHAASSANILYFGCRSASKDQHYVAEWKQLVAENTLVYKAACSRDGLEGEKRTYVQDLIRLEAEQTWKDIGLNGAYVLISGSSNKMPTAVKAALQFSAQEFGRLSESAAAAYIQNMEKDGRLIEECWS